MGRVAGLILLLVGVTTACTTSPNTASDEVSPSTAIDKGEIGVEKQSNGVFVTIIQTRRVVVSQMCKMDGSSDDFDFCHSRGLRDSDVILVETNIRNETDRALGLSCNDGIHDSLLDEEGDRYPPTGSLDSIVGNPRCDELLQPGQDRTMEYAYVLPIAAPFTKWTFLGSTNPNDPPTQFRIADIPTRVGLSG